MGELACFDEGLQPPSSPLEPPLATICAEVYLTFRIDIISIDNFSPPEAGLRNVHLYDKEKESSPHLPSSGILYKDKGYSRPQASGLAHHSVFVKRKRSKLKNPFRINEGVDGEVLESQESRYDVAQLSIQ